MRSFFVWRLLARYFKARAGGFLGKGGHMESVWVRA